MNTRTKMSTDRCKLPGAFWQSIESLGVAPADVLKSANLSPFLYMDESAVVSTAQLFCIWNAIERVSGDAAFSLRMVSETRTPKHKIAFLAASYASNFRDGLSRVARFKRLCSPDRIRFNEIAGRVEVTIAWPPGTQHEPPLSVDANFALLLELGRRGCGQRLVPLSLALRRQQPATDNHGAYFGCAIEYGAPRDMMTLNATHLDLPFDAHNRELLDLLSPALDVAMQEIEKDGSVGEQVKSALKHVMSQGAPDLPSIARELGMSDRTLQRRITAEGSTFRVLLTEARQEMSHPFLADPALDLQEIAYLLGYEDASSFSRAFRVWTGVTPNAWRRGQPTRP